MNQLWNGSSYETLRSKPTFEWNWLDLRSLFHNWYMFHNWFTSPIIIPILHLSVRACVRAWEREVTGSHSTCSKKLPILRIARVGRYTREPTDTTSNGTSPGLKETLCNSVGQKFDREVSLRVAAWRRRTSAILESRLFTDAWQREVILF